MLDRISGIVRSAGEHAIVVSMGPIECKLQVPHPATFQEGARTDVYPYMHWNAEQGPSFYGFVSPGERQVFQLLLSCSGVGPKVGLAVLATLGSSGFIAAVAAEDARAIAQVNGIGPKRAEQLVFQLRSKVTSLVEASGASAGASFMQMQPLREALESLNYSRAEVIRAMEHVKAHAAAPSVTFDQLMRQALSFLAK